MSYREQLRPEEMLKKAIFISDAILAGVFLIIFLICRWRGGQWMNYDLSRMVAPRGTLIHGIKKIWPIFVVPGVLGSLHILFMGVGKRTAPLGNFLFMGFSSAVFEEIIYRVLLFASFMPVLHLIDSKSHGGFGRLMTNEVLPWADKITLQWFHPQFVYTQPKWWVGGAVLASNLVFALLHLGGRRKRQAGMPALINFLMTLIIGLAFAYIIFNYGLVGAMVVHFMANASKTLLEEGMAKLRRA